LRLSSDCVLYTNNDVEGWQRRLNTLARRGHLPLYQLLQLIFDGGQFLQMQARLLSECKLHRQRRRQYQDNNRKMDALWDDIQRLARLSTMSTMLKTVLDLSILNWLTRCVIFSELEHN